MIRRSTWLLFGTFLVLLIIVLVLEKLPASETRSAPIPTKTPSLFVDWSSASTINIRIKNRNNHEAITLKRNEQGIWKLDDSPITNVDQGNVEELLSTLLSIKPLTVLNNPPSLEILGLETPLLSIELTSRENQHMELHIGAKTPIGSGYYARTNLDNPIVLSINTTERIFYLSTMKTLTGE